MKVLSEKRQVAGVELFIRPANSDRCLFMLHGIGSNSNSFAALASALPEDIQLIAWSAPGYGASGQLQSPHPLPQHYADKLNEVVLALGLQRFVLLGHSLGTLIATAYAQRFSDKLQGLILLACAQGHEMQAGAALPDKAQKRLTDLAAKGVEAFARERAPRLLHNPEQKPELLDATVKAMAAINVAGYSQAVSMLAAGNLTQLASKTCIDSLTIVGREDQITPVLQSKNCHDALAIADTQCVHNFVIVPEAGHLVHLEQPALVAQSILEFTGWNTALKSEPLS